MTESAFDQSSYQIRLDWGIRAFETLGPAHVVVLVDALALGGPSEEELLAAVPPLSTVVRGSFSDRSAVARWILDHQRAHGGRTSVNLVAVGEALPDGSVRFALEDQLAAGAIVDALTELGIDHSSPDAAVASAAFLGLRHATRHILSASPSGRRMRDDGRGDELSAASAIDRVETVVVLREAAAG